jgi:hypothetical protein
MLIGVTENPSEKIISVNLHFGFRKNCHLLEIVVLAMLRFWLRDKFLILSLLPRQYVNNLINSGSQ